MDKQMTTTGSLKAALCLALALLMGAGGAGTAQAETLEAVLGLRSATTVDGAQSQAKIDQIADDTANLLAQYKRVLKVVESLRIYNEQKRRLIKNQEIELKQLDEAIVQATTLQRLIDPLIVRMVNNLEQFIKLDMPFLPDERAERIAFLKEVLDRADVSTAEKFNQIFSAYQLENTFGTTIEAYTEIIPIDGASRQVDMLKWGRVALVFQTPDGEITGAWDRELGEWVILGNSYRRPVRDALRIANKTQTANLVHMPIPVPKAAGATAEGE